MKKIKLKIIFFIILNFSIYEISNSEITNKIIIKVGNKIITSHELQNDILTNLTLNKIQIDQENINKIKNFSVKSLINKRIKRIEIEKFKFKNYNKKDLQDYLNKTAESFNTNLNGLKIMFKENKISYNIFVENYETELIWNSLIYNIYNNQLNINLVDVENEISKFKKDKTEKEIQLLRKNAEDTKKEEKLNLFSRSHFANLENSIQIEFK